jgi:tRNA pseudouridine38-40 synthase
VIKPATQTLKLTIAYHGARFRGWQKGNGRTVQGTLIETIRNALPRISRGAVPEDVEIRLDGAGRTDAGVHASGQVASVVLPASIDAARLLPVVNQLLPSDVALLSVEPAHDRYHARYRSTARTYRYTVLDGPVGNPFLYGLVWRYQGDLDIGSMQEAARVFIGQHDFSAFTADKPRPNKKRTIHSISISRQTASGCKPIEIHIRGDGFLWRQVRIMVGALVEVGAGRLTSEDVQRILASGDRSQAPAPAPACGLTLLSVE